MIGLFKEYAGEYTCVIEMDFWIVGTSLKSE